MEGRPEAGCHALSPQLADLNVHLEAAGFEDEEFLLRVEEAARAVAKEEGERCCRELTLDEVLDLPFDDPGMYCDF